MKGLDKMQNSDTIDQTSYDLLYDKEYYSEYLCLEHFVNKKLGQSY